MEAEKKKRAASGKSVTALLQEQDSEDDSSDDDLRPPCGAVWQKVGPSPCCKPFASMPICELSTPTMNSFNSLADDMPNLVEADDFPSQADVASSLQGWAHSVRRSSDKKTKASKTMRITNSDDLDKLERLLCSASKRHSAKTLQRIHEEAELDHLSQLIERPSTHPKHLERTVKRVWAMVDSGSFVTIANLANTSALSIRFGRVLDLELESSTLMLLEGTSRIGARPSSLTFSRMAANLTSPSKMVMCKSPSCQ